MSKRNKAPGKPTPPNPSRIVNKAGLVYHPTNAPDGLCKCGVMLALKPQPVDYIFPSHIRANHAREHTIRFLKLNNLPYDPDDFITVPA